MPIFLHAYNYIVLSFVSLYHCNIQYLTYLTHGMHDAHWLCSVLLHIYSVPSYRSHYFLIVLITSCAIQFGMPPNKQYIVTLLSRMDISLVYIIIMTHCNRINILTLLYLDVHWHDFKGSHHTKLHCNPMQAKFAENARDLLFNFQRYISSNYRGQSLWLASGILISHKEAAWEHSPTTGNFWMMQSDSAVKRHAAVVYLQTMITFLGKLINCLFCKHHTA